MTPARVIPRFPALRVALVATAAAAIAVGIVSTAGPASAHNYLISSTPEAGSTLTVLPAQFQITTNDALLDLGTASEAFALQVQDSSGLYYGDGCVDIAGATMTTTASLGAAGGYTVTWGVISTDGHPISDTFDFTWAPDATAVPSKGSATAPVCGTTTIEADVASPSPTPETPTATPTATPTPTATLSPSTTATDDGTGDGGTAAPWIIGAVVAVAAGVAATLAFTRRRSKA
ncbi:MAG: copper resistance protein CopC [Burkholderiaceae bacterium]|nr:copper resistance protein CopC [Microbacteriaceae bacterium]